MSLSIYDLTPCRESPRGESNPRQGQAADMQGWVNKLGAGFLYGVDQAVKPALLLVTKSQSRRKNSSNLEYRNKKPNDIHEGKWNGLGGKFEAGETPEMCITREVQEETGLIIHNPRLHGLLVFTNFKGNDWYVFVFTASEFEGELLEASPEGKLEWIDDDKLTSLNLWESDHIFFPWIAQGKFFSAKFEYEGDVMLGYEVNFH